MLLYFKTKNYRSLKNEAILDMEAAGMKDNAADLLSFGKNDYLPAAAVYGKNGGGKSNLIRAMWLAVQFICNAQKTQTEKAKVPVSPFRLDNYSADEPTEFEFCYVHNSIKYIYGFSATQEEIKTEYLKAAPNGRESVIFSRENGIFKFPQNNERRKKEMISEAVAKNQLFFAVSCTMNYKPCIEAMGWFRDKIVFSRDYTDINQSLLDYSEDEAMLQAIVSAAKSADVGIQDMKFEMDNQEIDFNSENLPKKFKGMYSALIALAEALKQNGNEAEMRLRTGELKSTAYHSGVNKNGEQATFELGLSDESDGTRRLMALAPAIEKTLKNGGVLIVDELERELHLMLMEYVINRYQKSKSNQNQAQLIFTTHETTLLNQEILRRDQIYFVDKDKTSGVSELYSLSDFNIRNDMINIQKAYLLGRFGAVPCIEEV